MTPETLQEAVDRLRQAGLYAQGSTPKDWENSVSQGNRPLLIRGGSHVANAQDIGVLANAFFIEATSSGYLVTLDALRTEDHFGYLTHAVEHVIKNVPRPT